MLCSDAGTPTPKNRSPLSPHPNFLLPRKRLAPPSPRPRMQSSAHFEAATTPTAAAAAASAAAAEDAAARAEALRHNFSSRGLFLAAQKRQDAEPLLALCKETWRKEQLWAAVEDPPRGRARREGPAQGARRAAPWLRPLASRLGPLQRGARARGAHASAQLAHRTGRGGGTRALARPAIKSLASTILISIPQLKNSTHRKFPSTQIHRRPEPQPAILDPHAGIDLAVFSTRLESVAQPETSWCAKEHQLELCNSLSF